MTQDQLKDNQSLNRPSFHFLLQGWGQFQVLHEDGTLLLACSSIGHNLVTCLGHFKDDQFAFEVTSFFGDETHVHKNDQLHCRLTIVSYRTWLIEFYDQKEVVEIFKTAFNAKKQQYDVYLGLDGPLIIELIPCLKKHDIVQPKITAHYTSNRSFADLFMVLGFILCKRKI